MIDEAGIVGDPSEGNNTANNTDGIGEKGNLYNFIKYIVFDTYSIV